MDVVILAWPRRQNPLVTKIWLLQCLRQLKSGVPKNPADVPPANMNPSDPSATKDYGHIFATPRVCHTLEVLDDACTTFTSEHIIEIKARMRSRFFVRRFKWTGSDGDEIPELETSLDIWGHPKHRIHGPIVKEGKWRVIVVDVGSTFEVGDVDTLHFRHHLRDLAGVFEPFLGHSPKLGTKYLKLEVVLPHSVAGKVFFVERMLDSEEVKDNERLTGAPLPDGRIRFTKVVEKPIDRNRNYRISWNRLP